jgi:hypothetical protein
MAAESPTQLQPLWTARECARFLRCCLRSLDAYRRAGLPHFRIGRKLLFDPVQVRTWLREESAKQGGMR